MKNISEIVVSHGKVTFCSTCEGSGILHMTSAEDCYDCGGRGILFDGKGFSVRYNRPDILAPNKDGTELIEPADDIHKDALIAYQHKMLQRKVDAIDEYKKAVYFLQTAKRLLKAEGINFPSTEIDDV